MCFIIATTEVHIHIRELYYSVTIFSSMYLVSSIDKINVKFVV